MNGDLKAIVTLAVFGFGIYQLIQSLPRVERAWGRLTR